MIRAREATDAADEVIKALKALGYKDFTPSERNTIGLAFDQQILEGHTDATVTFESGRTLQLLIIQEDHYDQHMDEEEDKPSWDDMVASICHVPSYFWIEKK